MKWIGVAVIITALVIIGIKIDFGNMGVEADEDINSLSIAVLPFANMSSDPDNAFFADGITEDILTQLSKIKSLEVISRTSIMQYKNTTKSLRKIGKELGVANILEGSVRRGGNNVRITAQLINAETDKHIWAESYDRKLDDIFAIQSDVALKIANALEASLSPSEEDRINEIPTSNLEAYDFYLKGNVQIAEFGNTFERKPLEGAIASYEEAVSIDSNYVLAYTQLAQAHLWMYWGRTGEGWDRTEERLTKAKRAIDKASRIDSEHPYVQIAMGYYYYRGFRNYDDALKYFISSLEKQPNNSDVLASIGYVYRRQGKLNSAITYVKKAVDLDPRAYIKTYVLTQMYAYNRMWKQAGRYSDRLLLLNSKSQWGYYWKNRLIYLSGGDLKESRMVLDRAMENIDPNKLIEQQGYLYYFERNFSEALNVFESDKRNWYRWKGFLHSQLGHPDKSHSYYDSMRVEAINQLNKNPKNVRALSNLGLAYAGLGRKGEAIEKGLEAVELLPLSKDALSGIDGVEYLARIFTMVGEYDKAIDQLELLLSIPSRLTEYILRLDPRWDSLREHPRFIKLVEN